MAGVAYTAGNASSTNSALANPNDQHAIEMDVLDQTQQHVHAQYTTELK